MHINAYRVRLRFRLKSDVFFTVMKSVITRLPFCRSVDAVFFWEIYSWTKHCSTALVFMRSLHSYLQLYLIGIDGDDLCMTPTSVWFPFVVIYFVSVGRSGHSPAGGRLAQMDVKPIAAARPWLTVIPGRFCHLGRDYWPYSWMGRWP